MEAKMARNIALAAVSVVALIAAGAIAQEAQDETTGSINPAEPGTVLTGEQAFGDWREDAPGVIRHIRVADLGPPGMTESASNAPETVPMPQGIAPEVPEGFTVELVASGIENPRVIRFAPNGDLFVANSEVGEVLVFHWPEGAEEPEQHVFVDGLNQPYGIAFYPPGDNPEWIYIAESDGLKRFPYKPGDLELAEDAEGEALLQGIPAEHHWTRDVAFSPDGETLYYSVGSGSNVGLDMTMEPEPEGGLEAWIGENPLGAAWGGEERRATVLAFDANADDPTSFAESEEIFATGLRNCSGMTIQPATGELWCVVNERDELGDNIPFDYATTVAEGAFYGWPWYYIGDNPDPRWSQTPREDLADDVTVPDVLFQSHSAPLNIAFYEHDAFGPEYKGDAFVAMHGSWNRNTRTGYKVVRLDFDENGEPTGTYEDFMTGFVMDNAEVWGRPVGVAVGPDGSLYVSEDGSGTIWKISKQS
jgi:glucose/arabinose dehydrogenase